MDTTKNEKIFAEVKKRKRIWYRWNKKYGFYDVWWRILVINNLLQKKNINNLNMNRKLKRVEWKFWEMNIMCDGSIYMTTII